MLNLIIDQGNTKTKFYIFDINKKIIHKTSCPKDNQKLCISVLSELFNFKISNAIYSSVSGLNDAIIERIRNLSYHIIFDYTTPIPINNLYQSKQTLGTDRLAGAIGARCLFPDKNLLIIDIGTAITYDFVNSQGQFLGGNISPGPHIRFSALHDYTASLPKVELDEPQRLIAQNTKEAILNGVLWGIYSEINGIIKLSEGKFDSITPILSGGYAYFFGKMFKSYIFVEANLVPIGLNCVLEYNKKLDL